jgi:hypothetical protein
MRRIEPYSRWRSEPPEATIQALGPVREEQSPDYHSALGYPDGG